MKHIVILFTHQSPGEKLFDFQHVESSETPFFINHTQEAIMKRQFFTFATLLLLFMSHSFVFAQGNITVIAPTTEIANDLDLEAVGELFREADNLEAFERVLNDPDVGINNLDLNGDGYVDYIRVVEDVIDYTHLIILQVPLGENEFQDVATIEVERTDEDEYNMQIRGNEYIYGPDYYVAPARVHIHTWPIIVLMYRASYRPYRSVFYFGYYPAWWRTYHHVHHHVYHTRIVHYRTRTTFVVNKTNRVHSVKKIKYTPRNSTLVKKPTRTKRTITTPNRVEKRRTLNRSSRGSIRDKSTRKVIRPKSTRTDERKYIRRDTGTTVKKSSDKSRIKKVTRPKTDAKKPVKKKQVKKSSSEKKSSESNAQKGSLGSSVKKKKFQ